jgi:hypothetical protein
MFSKQKKWPSVPSSPDVPDYDSSRCNTGAEGAKNLWVGHGCHLQKTTSMKKDLRNFKNLKVATYNVRTLKSDDRLCDLEQELEKIKWDIVGLSEVRRRDEQCLRLPSSHTLFYRGSSEGSYGGVGFLINSKISPQVKVFKAISERVIYITLEIDKQTRLKIIQVYAPTSTYDENAIQ